MHPIGDTKKVLNPCTLFPSFLPGLFDTKYFVHSSQLCNNTDPNVVSNHALPVVLGGATNFKSKKLSRDLESGR